MTNFLLFNPSASVDNMQFIIRYVLLLFLAVTRFKVPDDFQSILQSQTHGPTTQLIASDYYAKRSFDPKVQVQYDVPSGTTPRKVEVER